MQPDLAEVTRAVADLELERIRPILERALEQGSSAASLLRAMTDGMVRVGELFEQGEYFLVDLTLAGELMKEGLAVLEPRLTAGDVQAKGTVVLCTVKGDVHDIGKNLVATMLTGAGFRVVDLGVDVHESKVVDALRSTGARALGLSVLLTPMIASVSDVVSAITAAGLRNQVRIAIGGACTTPELVARLGLDALGRDPMEAVRLFDSFLAESRS